MELVHFSKSTPLCRKCQTSDDLPRFLNLVYAAWCSPFTLVVGSIPIELVKGPTPTFP